MENTNNNTSSFSQRISTSIIFALVGLGLFHFGSWHIVVNKHLPALDQLMHKLTKKSNFILDDNGIVIRINDAYYGFVNDAHYFDNTIIQWIMLVIALAIFLFAIEHLFGFDD